MLHGWDRTVAVGCMFVCEDCGVRHETRPVRLRYIQPERNDDGCIVGLCDECTGYQQPPPPAPPKGPR